MEGRKEGFPFPNLLVFQMCRVSGSVIPLFSACSSRKSKKYFTATGGLSSRILRMALNKSSRNFCSVPCRTRTQWTLGGAAPKPREQQRGCDCCTPGETFAASWIIQRREGMPKQGGNSLSVDSDIINLHLGLISFGIKIFFLTAVISHLCLLCAPQTKKTRDCWPSL